MWQILVYEDGEEKRLTDLVTIQKEACVVITNGLTVLYPTTEDKHTLMMQLLNNGEIHSYSKTWMPRTPMTRLPWMIQTRS